MPLFRYKVVSNKGTIIEDTVVAQSSDDAAIRLKSSGYTVLSIKNTNNSSHGMSKGPVTVVEKAMFCRFLATMLKAGLPLLEAIEIIQSETKNKKLKQVLADVSVQIQKGQSLSSVLTHYKDDFDLVFTTIVKAGEETGNLDSSLDYLARQLLATHELIQKVKGALMYPMVIVFAMIGVGTIIISFVLPRVATAFSNLKMDMPWTTKLVFGVGLFINNHFILTILSMVGVAVLFIIVLSIKQTRSMLVKVIFKIPAIRSIAIEFDVARFSRTLSTLLHSGVPVLDALHVASEALSLDSLKIEAQKMSDGVARGISFAEALGKGKTTFPATLIQTIRAGEKTGKLDEVLLDMAEFYEREVDYTLKRAVSLLEPMLMLAVGVAVGAMVITIIAPIYSIVGGLQNSMGGK
jgi:type IV pilus assembly protein PilC